MPRKTDLEALIRKSYKLISEYEDILYLSDRPEEKERASRAIENQWAFVKGYLDEYIPLCERLWMSIPDDLGEIVARFPEYGDRLQDLLRTQELAELRKADQTSAAVPTEQPPFLGTSTREPMRVIEVFYSYSHRDEELRDKLERQLSILQRLGLVTSWHDRKIGAGKEWKGQIDTHLDTAQIILLLISDDFLASGYCWDVELKRAIERHEEGEARVIPVILRRVDWKGAPFEKLQVLPRDGKPVSSWANIDEAFYDVALGIRKAVEELKTNTTL